MSEIICSYSLQGNSGYFFMDAAVSFNQFTEFIASNISPEEFVIRNADTNEIINTEDQLQALLASGAVNILIVAPEVEPEQPKQESLFGPITQTILAQLNIELDENIDPREMIQSIPFPFSMIVRTKFDIICNNPKELSELVRLAASMFSVSYEELLVEATNTIEILKEKMNSEPKSNEQPKEQVPVPEEPKNETFIGPLTKTLLTRFGIEIDEDIDPKQMLEALPFPFSMIAQAKLDLLCNEPDALEEIVRRTANLTGVAFDTLFEEVKVTAKIIKAKLNPEAENNEEKPQEAKEDSSPVVHPAYCDNCQATIVGIRYKCLHCADYDLCGSCEEIQSKELFHDREHVFAKMYKSNAQRNQECGFVRGSFCPMRQRLFPIFVNMQQDVPQPQQPIAPGQSPNRRNERNERNERITNLEQSVELLQEQIRLLQE